MNTVHGPTRRGIGCQTRIVIGFFDQVLRSGPLIVEPRQSVDASRNVGDEDAIAVLRRFEQLVLFGLLRLLRGGLLEVAQRYKTIGLGPALRLIAELALAIGIDARRPGPARRA